MSRDDVSNRYILDYLETSYPNVLPLDRVDEYELGILIGQQMLIANLKYKLKTEQVKEMEDK